MIITINPQGQVVSVDTYLLVQNANFLNSAFIKIVLNEEFTDSEKASFDRGYLTVELADGRKIFNLLMVKDTDGAFVYNVPNSSAVFSCKGSAQFSIRLTTADGKALATVEQKLFIQANTNIKQAEEYDAVEESLKNEVVDPAIQVLNNNINKLAEDVAVVKNTMPIVVDEVLNLQTPHDNIDVGYRNSIDEASLNKIPQEKEKALAFCKTDDNYVYSLLLEFDGQKNEQGFYPFTVKEVLMLHNDKEIPLILNTISLEVEHDSIDNATFFVEKDKLNKTPKLGDMAYCLLKTIDEYVYQGKVQVSSVAEDSAQFTVVEKYLIHDASVIHSIGSLRIDIADVKKTVPIVLTKYINTRNTLTELLEKNNIGIYPTDINKTPEIGDNILCLLKTKDNFVIHAILKVETINQTVITASVLSHIVLHDGKLDELLNGKPLELSIVSARPETGNAGTIYVAPSTTPNTNNLYEEWIWVNDKWELFGAVSANLTLDGYIPYDALKPINGISKLSNGEVFIYTADKGTIENRNTDTAGWAVRLPIPPRYLDYAILKALTTNSETMTEEEQGNACDWLGAVKKSSKTNILYGNGENGETELNFNASPLPNMPAKRNYLGHIALPADNLKDDCAVPKKYVDDKFLEKITDVYAFVRVYSTNTKGEQQALIVATTPSAAFNGSLASYLAEMYGDTEAGGWLVTKTPTKPYHTANKKWVEDLVDEKTLYRHYVSFDGGSKLIIIVSPKATISSISDFIDNVVGSQANYSLLKIYQDAGRSSNILSGYRNDTESIKISYIENDSIATADIDLSGREVKTENFFKEI